MNSLISIVTHFICSVTHMSLQTILSSVEQILLVFFFLRTMEVNGNQNCLVTNIIKKISFCVPLNKVSQTGLERHENE